MLYFGLNYPYNEYYEWLVSHAMSIIISSKRASKENRGFDLKELFEEMDIWIPVLSSVRVIISHPSGVEDSLVYRKHSR